MVDHTLWERGDPGLPAGLADRNGDVVLAMCRICGQVEADLEDSCPAASHADHGRGSPDDGPDDSDCPCRGTVQQAECADSGCGFCAAALAALQPAKGEGE